MELDSEENPINRAYAVVAQNKDEIKKKISADTGLSQEEIDHHLPGAIQYTQNASKLSAQGVNPAEASPAQVQQASNPLKEYLQKADQITEQDRESDKKAAKEQLIASAFLNTLPTIIGAAFGGTKGGAIGAQVGTQSTQDYMKASQEGRKEQHIESKERRGALLEAGKEEAKLNQETLEKEKQRKFEGLKERDKQDFEIKLANAKNEAERDKLYEEYGLKAGLENYKSQFDNKKSAGEKTVFAYGQDAPTKEVAKEINQQVADGNMAKSSINKLLEIADTPLTSIKPETKAKANVIARSLRASLRLPILGTGPVNDSERAILESIAADPTKMFSLDAANKAALKELINFVDDKLDFTVEANGMDPKRKSGRNPVAAPSMSLASQSPKGPPPTKAEATAELENRRSAPARR